MDGKDSFDPGKSGENSGKEDKKPLGFVFEPVESTKKETSADDTESIFSREDTPEQVQDSDSRQQAGAPGSEPNQDSAQQEQPLDNDQQSYSEQQSNNEQPSGNDWQQNNEQTPDHGWQDQNYNSQQPGSDWNQSAGGQAYSGQYSTGDGKNGAGPSHEQAQSGAAGKQKKKKPTKTPMSQGVIGGIIGGLVTAAVVLLVLFFTGNLGTTKTYQTSSGQSITIDSGDYQSEVEAVAQIVPQSVVGVYTVGTETTSNAFGQNSSQQYSATGSGFIVTTDGYIVTNQHVVTDNPSSITVSLADDSEYDAKVVWSDSSLDLAVLKINASGLQAVTLGDSSTCKVGETVIAIGNPLGLDYSRSVTSGIISALNRSLVVDNNLVAEDLIQTDAAINSGNSGGPLVNGSGEVIGINTYKASQGEGMGFALPINIIKPILNDIIETGSFNPVSIGISGYDKEVAKYMVSTDTDLKAGIYISSVTANSPASKAGLQKGDIILKADGTEVNTMLALKEIIYTKHSGDKISITYSRNGVENTVDLTL
ncbi:MAG: S1C family serine protease [Eubacteriaceae bacterium]